MKTRNIIRNEGGEPFAVRQHIILKNFWEYYLGEAEKVGGNDYGIAFGYVMGFENEWGSVDLNEIKPYVISATAGSGLKEIMPPAGYRWEDEKVEEIA